MCATAILFFVTLLTPPDCSPEEGSDRLWNPQNKLERAETRARVRATCEAMGAAAEACDVLDAMVVRESSGDACAIHVRGPGEYGVGPLGLSWRWHRHKWFQKGEATWDQAALFHVPEISAIVALRLYRIAVDHHGAKTWMDVQAVYAGRFEDGRPARRAIADRRWCARLEARGLDCTSSPRGKLGSVLGKRPEAGQETFVLELISARAQP